MVTAEKAVDGSRSTGAPKIPDTRDWLTRNEATDMLSCALQTLVNYERKGFLTPQHAYRPDARGVEHGVWPTRHREYLVEGNHWSGRCFYADCANAFAAGCDRLALSFAVDRAGAYTYPGGVTRSVDRSGSFTCIVASTFAGEFPEVKQTFLSVGVLNRVEARTVI